MAYKEAFCSFCGRKKNEVDLLLSGTEGHICNHCIVQGNDLVQQELFGVNTFEGEKKKKKKKSELPKFDLRPPKELKKYLDDYVIGQDEAKKVLSVAVYNHYKRLMQPKAKDDVTIEKSNIIMVGETGTGKTFLARTISKMLQVPFAIADATVLTEAGYVGEDVESILSRLLQAADYNIELAERGIVYIDELDKIARKSDNPSITRDVSGEGVQQGLLKLLEGSIVSVPPQGGRKHPEQKMEQINTENILFICGGAFDGIDRHISKRINKQPIGFSTDKKLDSVWEKENMLRFVTQQDLKSFGLIPELIGRLPLLTYLNPLDKDTLKKILLEPKNSLVKQYKKLFAMEDINIVFEDEALDFIVDQAVIFKLGARGLRSICEAILTDAMFELPSEKDVKEFVLTLDYAKKKFEGSSYYEMKLVA
ncbi:ATP-dependent Clp protease ATP-binding subunit ClpX [uncultured Arcticibacterium sp.]|uniref:ATP-dependent Clp protease ATP-binding subunit ClpX n=1 Tax=uncultured Arcticibacterium sp. TaxID=2173042 RepID=UPI0030F8D590